MKDPEVQDVLNRVRNAVAGSLWADKPTVELKTADARWLIANIVPPSEKEPPLVIPFGILQRYPIALVTVVTALWGSYMGQVPPGLLTLTVPVEPFLARFGKQPDQDTLRELTKILHNLYYLQKVAYQRKQVGGVDTLTVWLTPDILKRVRAYQESLRPHA